MALYWNPNALLCLKVESICFYTCKLKGLEEYRTEEPFENSKAVMIAWKEILTEGYLRLLCIETNELEDVFPLGDDTISRLVRVGCFVDALRHVSPNRKLNDKGSIAAIL